MMARKDKTPLQVALRTERRTAALNGIGAFLLALFYQAREAELGTHKELVDLLSGVSYIIQLLNLRNQQKKYKAYQELDMSSDARRAKASFYTGLANLIVISPVMHYLARDENRYKKGRIKVQIKITNHRLEKQLKRIQKLEDETLTTPFDYSTLDFGLGLGGFLQFVKNLFNLVPKGNNPNE